MEKDLGEIVAHLTGMIVGLLDFAVFKRGFKVQSRYK